MDTKIINIEFINDDYDEATEWFSKKLNKAYSFEYNNSNTIRDLFEYLMNKLSGDEIPIECDEYLQDHFYVKIGTSPVKVQLYFNLDEFLIINNISKLQLLYIFCPAGGAGAHIPLLGTIKIYNNEPEHKDIPHVHIYKNGIINREYCARFFLDDKFSVMKEDEKKLNKLFNLKQRKQWKEVLEKYKAELTAYYKAAQRGEQPEPFNIDYKGNRVWFK